MTKIEPGDVPRQPAGFEVRHDDRGATIVDAEATEVASLDDTAAALWELCDGETDVEEIIAAVCAVWDVEAEVAERDVRRTLRMLRDAGVLEWGRAVSETAWCRADATLHRRTTSAAVVLPAGVDEPLTLAGAAALVWDVLEEPTTSAEAIELLARACGQQPAEIAPHVEVVLGRLSEVGAIEPFGPAPC